MTNPVAPSSRRKTDSFTVVTRAHIPYGTTILEQQAFIRMLYLERKRTERSRRPLVLMLLETGKLSKSGADSPEVQSLVAALAEQTRETDIKGWYADGQIFGVIFTEIDDAQPKAVTGAILSRVDHALANTLPIQHIKEIRITFHVFPEDSNHNGSGQGSDKTFYPELDDHGNRSAQFLKRSIDIGGSVLAIICSIPVAIPIAMAIKLNSKGPVLFRQQRIGQYGKPFTFLKFRSMYTSNDSSFHEKYVTSLIKDETKGGENGPSPIFKLTNDPRITRVGRLLRRTSLDELPQFLNVLRGEMSLVGPRPALAYEVAKYDIWHRHRLFAVKPGITGLWQVAGRSRTKFAEMVRLDLQYARCWTPWMDIKILLRTPRAVFSGDGAY